MDIELIKHCIAATFVLQGYCKGVERVLQEDVSRVLLDCQKVFTWVFQKCSNSFRGFTKVLQGCFNFVKWVFQLCYTFSKTF